MARHNHNPSAICRGRGHAVCRNNAERQGTPSTPNFAPSSTPHVLLFFGPEHHLTPTSNPHQITFDLATQVQPAHLPELRDQILLLLKKFAPGPRPVRVQLCVCLAILAIQMIEWKDVLPTVIRALGDDVDSHACILDFLRVLPEEVTEGRKITLSEEELADRTQELLGDNAEEVIALLTSYSQSHREQMP